MQLDMNNPEDRLIRTLLIVLPSALVGLLLLGAIVITVMISTNFNILNWME